MSKSNQSVQGFWIRKVTKHAINIHSVFVRALSKPYPWLAQNLEKLNYADLTGAFLLHNDDQQSKIPRQTVLVLSFRFLLLKPLSRIYYYNFF